jgi:hypothetical protein
MRLIDAARLVSEASGRYDFICSVTILRGTELLVLSLLEARPRHGVERAVSSLLPELVPSANAVISSFSELQSVAPLFFRRGVAQSHRDEMPDELHELFLAHSESATAMRLLRYDQRPVQNLA